MRTVATAFIGVGVLTVSAMTGFGLDPRATSDLLPRVAFGLAGGMFVLGLMLRLVAMVVLDARRIEAVGVDANAVPIREFGYRWRRLHAGLPSFFAALLAAPLLLVWPLLWAVAPEVAAHPAMIAVSGLLFPFAAVLFVVGRRGWSARVTVYPDRLTVRGIYSNGSLRWDEARRFLHEEVFADRWNTMWVYVLVGAGRFVRVEYTVESPEQFVREVEARTGLRLEKVPLTAR